MTTQRIYYPAALTVAGSDSGGGAGIQADLRTFAAFGVFGCSAITAVTAQNPHIVNNVEQLSSRIISDQIRTVADKIALDAVKVGMIGSAEAMETVARELENFNIPVIIDPVMISTSGSRLLDEDAVEFLQNRFLHLADWITPNLHEAEAITGMKISTLSEMAAAAKFCSDKWQCSCIIKGGHAAAGKDNTATDIVCHNGKLLKLSSPFVADSNATHGTGCTFSSAFTAALALQLPWKKALKAAKDFVFGSIAEAVELGADTEAMYPPQNSYIEEIKLKRCDK